MRIRKIRGVTIGLVIALAGFALGLTTITEGATTESVSLRPGQSVTVTCSGGTLQGTWSTPLVANCAANTTTTVPRSTTTTTPSTTTTTTTTPSTTTTTSTSTTTTTSTSTTTTTTPSSSSVAFVQADDTGTINGNTTSIGSGQSNQVLAHDTGIGHSVVLMIQTLTNPGTETDTVTSVSSGMGTFQFVNSYNDGADFEIWVCRTRPAQPTRSRLPRRPMLGTPLPWSSTLPPLAS